MLLFFDMSTATGTTTPDSPSIIIRLARPAIAAGLLILAVSVVALWFDALANDTLPTPATIELGVPPDSLSAAVADTPCAELDCELTARVTTTDRTGILLINTAATTVLIAIVMASLMLMYRIAHDAERGDHFTDENVTRLRRIATLAAVFGAMSFIESGVRAASSDLLGSDGFTVEFSFAPLLVAGLLAVIAEIWRSGVQLATFEREVI